MPLAHGAHHYTFPFPVLCAVPHVSHSCAQHCGTDCNLWAPAGKETELQSCAEVGPAVLPVLNLFVFHLGQNTQIQLLKMSAIASSFMPQNEDLGPGKESDVIIQLCVKSVTR